jgi:uroporphyrinogen-III synthase
MPGELAGLRVLVTRPALQADHLAKLVEAADGTAVRFPVVEVVPAVDTTPLDGAAERFSEFDIAIFVSANAVRYAAPRIAAHTSGVPVLPLIGALGDGTARTLAAHGLAASLLPDGRYSADGLLATVALNRVAGCSIVIFSGDKGRPTLAKTLTARGADVEVVECYQVVSGVVDPGPLLDEWRDLGMGIVTVTSVRIVENLYDRLAANGRSLLLRAPVVAMSERVAHVCSQLGWEQTPLVAEQANDVGIVNTIKHWRRTNPA